MQLQKFYQKDRCKMIQKGRRPRRSTNCTCLCQVIRPPRSLQSQLNFSTATGTPGQFTHSLSARTELVGRQSGNDSPPTQPATLQKQFLEPETTPAPPIGAHRLLAGRLRNRSEIGGTTLVNPTCPRTPRTNSAHSCRRATPPEEKICNSAPPNASSSELYPRGSTGKG